MHTTDPLGLAYADLLIGQYDCVDRIILNAYLDSRVALEDPHLVAQPGGQRRHA